MNTMKLECRDFLKEAIKDAIDIQLDGFTFDDIVEGLEYSFDYYVAYDCEAFKLFNQYSYFLREDVEKNIKENDMSIKNAIIYTIHDKALDLLYQIKDKIEELINMEELGNVGKRYEMIKLVDELYLDCYGDVA